LTVAVVKVVGRARYGDLPWAAAGGSAPFTGVDLRQRLRRLPVVAEAADGPARSIT
jgi:hypothetical protein